MMRSTFAGFSTATLALCASQRALEVTGQNISNVNTPGYTRQRLDIQSLYLRGGEFYNSNPNSRIGFGVEITGVSQLRDPFLDIQYRNPQCGGYLFLSFYIPAQSFLSYLYLPPPVKFR